MNIYPDAKRVLVYGDSITWGRVANKFERYDVNTRWAGVVQYELGEGYEIIEEGLRGRFLKGENPFIPNRDGLKQFGPILASHFPLDLVIIFLGTNDTSSKANKEGVDIANGLHEYIKEIESWCKEFQTKMPKILIVSPPLIDETNLKPRSMFSGSRRKSKELAGEYEKVALENGAYFFDSSKCTTPGIKDGVHIDARSHIQLGKSISPIIKNILS